MQTSFLGIRQNMRVYFGKTDAEQSHFPAKYCQREYTNPMQLPILISAFGTTSKAIATYTQLDTSIRNHFPHSEIIWAYSSKTITRELQKGKEPAALNPEQVLQQLAARGRTKVVVQSLHLFPGTEFHRLVQLAAHSPLKCAIGMPLFTSPADYDQIGELIRPIIAKRPEKAIVILGHGTDHPTWTAYYTLEKILRKKYGESMYVGVVEKYPDTDDLVDEIADRGFRKVCIIPLFLVAGMHYRRDIVSDAATSWQSRLQRRKIEVESLDYGLGLYPGIDQIIIRHIAEAAASFT